MDWLRRSVTSATHIRSTVPVAVVAYAFLGILDLGFSQMAFFAGYGEANPLLRATLSAGTFASSKVTLTLLVVLVGTMLWPVRLVRGIVWVANFAMAGVAGFHVFGLVTHILK